jgi:tRNA(fMet)-specific endonuclease VapC
VKFVLDTNHLIGVLKSDPRVRSRADALSPRDVGIPLLALGEALYGAYRSARASENLTAIARLRAVLPVLPVTDSIVERYARVRADLAARGRPKGDFDLVIACTALEHGADAADERRRPQGRGYRGTLRRGLARADEHAIGLLSVPTLARASTAFPASWRAPEIVRFWRSG